MRLQDLEPASFRGVRFYVPKDDVEEGRNTIEHMYPDSSRRYLEDNGALPANFDISAVLHGPNVAAQWSALRSALTKPGAGTLRHPWYGRQRVAVMGRFRVRRDDRRSGVLEINIPFGVTSSGSFPSLLSGIPAVVGGLASAAISAAFAKLAENWTTGSSAATSAALTTELSNVTTALATGLKSTTAAAADILDQPHPKIENTALLQSSLEALFLEPFSDLSLDGSELTNAFKKVCTVVDQIYVTADSMNVRTTESELRRTQLRAFADYVGAANFAALAWSMSDREHKTSDEVSTDESTLSGLIESIQETTLDYDTHNAIVDVYTAISEVLSDKVLRVPRISSVEIQGFSASALSYALYDDHDQAQPLIDLNPLQNPIWFDEAANILTEV